MFLPNPIACDVCKAVKQPSNHWFYASTKAAELWVIYPWSPVAEKQEAGVDAIVHLCGQACAVKKLAEWMNAQKQEPENATGKVAPMESQNRC